VALAVAASDTKAGNIRVLDVRPLIYWTQYFVVATAFSRPQMDAMAKRMGDLAEGQFKRTLSASERMAPGPWTLLDYGDVVVHLFAPRERERYAIEEFYANAREVPLPFVQERGRHTQLGYKPAQHGGNVLASLGASSWCILLKGAGRFFALSEQ